MRYSRFGFGFLALTCSLAAGVAYADATSSLKAGKADLKSAGALAFGPDGVLFVGDSAGGAIYAFDTQDRKAVSAAAKVEIDGIGDKVAALLGVAPDQIAINDVVANPLSRNVYLSVARGRGPDALPVILRTDGNKLQELSIDKIKFAKIDLPNAPAVDAKDARGQALRRESITDLEYVEGKLLVAGLSNEEFASNLRAIPFPFQAASRGSSVEIYHGNHGRFETNAPVRTFVQYKIGGQPNILAAYTCTPLVKIPVAELKPGNKIAGVTIAELGAMNRPLDMIMYNKDGADHILMSNSARGVMKMSVAGIEKYSAITERVGGTAGLPYETVADLKGVVQLDRLDANNAVLLVKADSGALDLKTIGLP